MTEPVASTSEKTKKLLDITLFPKLDLYFAKNQNLFFYISLGLLLVFGILLFDLRVSDGGDDSSYLMQAMQFSKGESYPNFHGIFYIVLLGWLINVVGFKLVLFKALSLVFMLVHQVFFFLSFKNRISPFLLSVSLLVTSVCSGLLIYASLTYTEAFYLMLQGGLLFIFIVYLKDLPGTVSSLKSSWHLYLIMGLILFIMAKTRSIGLVALVAVLLYYLLQKKWIPALITPLSYFVFAIPYNLYKKLAWGIEGSDTSQQLSILLQKDPYNKALGYEDFPGMIVRFFENAKIYLSGIMMQELGLKSLENENSGYFLTIIITLILLGTLWWSLRTKKHLVLFSILYLGLAMGASFFALNQMWSQGRLVIIYLPLFLISTTWTLGKLANHQGLTFLRPVLALLICWIFIGNLARTFRKVGDHNDILKETMAGNRYYGYDPGIENFLRISNWAAANIPDTCLVGSRKPSMSFIYGNGRAFYPIYRFPYIETDSLLSVYSGSNDSLYFINEMELAGVSKTTAFALRRKLEGIISFNDAVYSLFEVEPATLETFDSLLSALPSSNPIKGISAFRKKMLAAEVATSAVRPDDLLNQLYKNKVYYLINFTIKIDPEDKNSVNINTIDRWMIAIRSKYSNAFKLTKQIGKKNESPSYLWAIDYDYCKQHGWQPE